MRLSTADHDAPQATPRVSHPWLAAVTVFALLLLYVGSYFALQVLPDTWQLPKWATLPSSGLRMSYVDINGDWQIFPDYHGLPDALFVPMHELDRRWLHPGKWEGHHARTGELDFDWLLTPFAPTAAPAPAPVKAKAPL